MMRKIPYAFFSFVISLTCCLNVFGQDDAPAEVEEAPNTPTDNNVDNRGPMALLAKAQKPETVLWLETQNEEFLALHQPALKAKPKGAILMLHAAGQHPDWPGTLRYLRTHLPKLGWHSLSISLPDPAKPKPVSSDSNASTEQGDLDETDEIFDPNTDSVSDGNIIPETESAMANDDPEAKAVERIVAAVAHLRSENIQPIVLYGQGIGALRASKYWVETGDNSVAGIISVDGQNSVHGDGFLLTDSFTNPRMPFLDIIQNRRLEIELDAKQRAEKASIINSQAYQQHWFVLENEQIGNLIYGFLRRHN